MHGKQLLFQVLKVYIGLIIITVIEFFILIATFDIPVDLGHNTNTTSPFGIGTLFILLTNTIIGLFAPMVIFQENKDKIRMGITVCAAYCATIFILLIL